MFLPKSTLQPQHRYVTLGWFWQEHSPWLNESCGQQHNNLGAKGAPVPHWGWTLGVMILQGKGNPRFWSRFQGVRLHFIQQQLAEIASTPGRAGDSTPELLLRSISGLTMQQDQFAFATHQAGWWQPRLQLPQHTGLLFAELVL